MLFYLFFFFVYFAVGGVCLYRFYTSSFTDADRKMIEGWHPFIFVLCVFFWPVLVVWSLFS